jgi:hypothetical protein
VADDERGPVAPVAPDSDRDRRVDAYRDRERRRAARALDHYIQTTQVYDTPGFSVAHVAGERFVEAVGDYVLARLDERGACPLDGSTTCYDAGLHQKAHYGVVRGDLSNDQRDAAAEAYSRDDGTYVPRGGDFACPGRRGGGPNSRPVCGMPDWDHDAHMYGPGSTVMPDYGVTPTTGAPYADVYPDEAPPANDAPCTCPPTVRHMDRRFPCVGA